ncbi:hypothetical protein MXB_184, partial [Myxobolus squamalis]
TSPSPLIQCLNKDCHRKNDNPKFLKYTMSSIIEDSSVWPYVWTCFGRACIVQYSQDDYYGPEISLSNLADVDEDINLTKFQQYWTKECRFMVVGKEILSELQAKIKICSSLYADRHAGHLNVTLPVHHPFFVENKGWCQVESSNIFFKSLLKMDIITDVCTQEYFKFDEDSEEIGSSILLETGKDIFEESSKEEALKPECELFTSYNQPIHQISDAQL